MGPTRQRLDPLAVPGLVHGLDTGGHPAPEPRDAQRRRVTEELREAGRLHLLTQVHGAAVHQAPWEGRPEGDAAFAPRAGLILGIETADCLPVFLVDQARQRVAAAHAGWRGTAKGVSAMALQTLLAHGTKAPDVVAILGPCIGPCCYEVGDEVVGAFGEDGRRFFVPGRGARLHLDVRAANQAQLEALGLASRQIHQIDECTRCRGDLYPSYRRDGQAAGRILSFVGYARPADTELVANGEALAAARVVKSRLRE